MEQSIYAWCWCVWSTHCYGRRFSEYAYFVSPRHISNIILRIDRTNIAYQNSNKNLVHYQWNGSDWNYYEIETHLTLFVGTDVSMASIGTYLHVSYSRSDGDLRHSTFNDTTHVWTTPDTVDTGEYSSIIDWMGMAAIAYVIPLHSYEKLIKEFLDISLEQKAPSLHSTMGVFGALKISLIMEYSMIDYGCNVLMAFHLLPCLKLLQARPLRSMIECLQEYGLRKSYIHTWRIILILIISRSMVEWA